MSLCRLWQKQGKQESARQMLAEIYNMTSHNCSVPTGSRLPSRLAAYRERLFPNDQARNHGLCRAGDAQPCRCILRDPGRRQ
jgi:hypothetical protein